MDDRAPVAPKPPPEPPPKRAGRLPGRIRSLPERPVRTRAPGTEPVGDGGDANWRRGVGILWTLFVLIALGEAFNLAVYLMAGGSDWLTVGNALRLFALCGGFLALWRGWTWTRWVLAVIALLVGVRTVLFSFIVNDYGRSAASAQAGQAIIAFVYFVVLLAVGVLYVVLAACLVFSADVVAFTEHRRKEGRRWMIVPVGLLVGGYYVAMLGAEYTLRHSLEDMRSVMSRLAQENVRTMVADWNPDSIKGFLDEKALRNWPDVSREGFMSTLRPLGTYLGPGDEDAGVFLNPGGIGTASAIRGECHETVRCSEGRATLNFTFTRPLFGSWRVESLNVGTIEFYEPAASRPKPPPTTTATPAVPPAPSTGG